MSRFMRSALTGLALTLAAVGSLVVAAPTAAADAPGRCADGLAIRAERNLSSTIRGRCYASHVVTVFCWSRGQTVDGSPYWSAILDNTTGVRGWVSNRFIQWFGRVDQCVDVTPEA